MNEKSTKIDMPNIPPRIDRPIDSYIREIEMVIGNGETIWLDETYTSKLRRILEKMKIKFGSKESQ